MNSWYTLSAPETRWLVSGLIPSDGHAAIAGKPKAGKSTFVRNLVVAILKSRPFIGRWIELPEDTGRVLYVHLDRKDQPWRVAAELKHLGVTEKDAPRLVFRTAQDIPETFPDRLAWLQKQVKEHQPHLVVIDLMWQFVVAENSSDYNRVLDGINQLQDALITAKYKGALVVTLHARKATNLNDPFDDVLGSTGQRGSFSTNIMLTRYRKEKRYTILSDQTERDEAHGEIDETILHRNEDGTLSLLKPLSELEAQEHEGKAEVTARRVLVFVSDHPGCEMAQLMDGLGMAKKTILKSLDRVQGLWRTEGDGTKGSPLKYFVTFEDDPKAATSAWAMGALTR